jgi:uncharacterized protein
MIRPVHAAALLVALSAFAGAAAAQDERDDRYFMLRDPFRLQRGLLNTPRNLDPRLAPAEPPAERVGGIVFGSAADADRVRLNPASEYVLVLGDSLSDQLAQGLADAFATERPEVAVIKRTRESSGLVRADFFDWLELGPPMVAAEKATAVIVLLGMNDRQVLRDETGVHQPRSDRWRELYAKRVEDFLTKLRDTKVTVYMVGLPSMRLPQLAADMPYLNEIFRERSAKVGVTFVDIWDGFVNEHGDFTVMGPALDGQLRRLRLNDGVHFSRFGGRKLAHFVERDLLRQFASRAGSPSLPLDTPDPGPGSRPVAGPVISLSVPSAQTGALAGGGTRTVPMDSTAIRTLVEGLPAETVKGRADDFRWPQPGAAAPAPAPAPGQAATVPLGVAR